MADRRRWWGLVAVGVLLTAGCGPDAAGGRQVQAARGQPSEGHVYLAQLAARHPLYADLAQIDEAIRALRRPDEPGALPLLDLAPGLGEPYVAGPVEVLLRATTLEARRARATARVSEALPVTPPDRLPPDLEAWLGWSRTQAERAATRELLEARSAAGRDLAAHIARVYRENQERLNDLGERVAGAPPAREAVIEELEADIARLRQEHEDRLARLEAQLADATRDRLAEAERTARDEARRRHTPPTNALSREPAEMMSRNMRAGEFPAWPADVRVQFPVPDLPAADATSRRAAGEVEREHRRDRERQAEALVRGRDATTSRILAATRLAVEKVARERGIRLHFPPADDPVGPDMTGEIGEAIAQLWAGDIP